MNIVCLGLSKTGTTSLQRACQKFGIKVCHATDSIEFRKKAVGALREKRKILHPFGPPGFFSNIFIPSNLSGIEDYYKTQEWRNYIMETILEQYPHTRFVLTVRDIDDWIMSRMRHVKSNQQLFAKKMTKKWPRWDSIDVKSWEDEYEHHYFNAKKIIPSDKLLIMNICAGDGYEKLCPFIGKKVLKRTKFPHENKSRKRQ